MPTYETSSRLELRDRAATLNDKYAGRPAGDVVSAVLRDEFQGKVALVSSFGTEAAVLLHMLAEVDLEAPVVFLETFKHFPETIDYRNRLTGMLRLQNLKVVEPTAAAIKADDPNDDLRQRNSDLCCHVRKTLPLFHALNPMQCWITGRKRYQASTRTAMQLFEVQDRWIKVNPLIDWLPEDIDLYFARHKLPQHPLKLKGFLSIGCAPCTRAVMPGEDPRAGRWADSGKTECGIHIENGKVVRSNQA
ncbi:MAG: phosphoadenylyl-sulfate reductase [Hyphomicrobiaceae bacterium]|nr:phosphoadenylyl-sulfate reductase [Hyphomicrobiaceae bacterium]MCC0022622.1 phosphoadenylyl-sulfate reductase [Hyphomicrobiaceae bacterium]